METLRPPPVDLQGIGGLASSAREGKRWPHFDQFLDDGKAWYTLPIFQICSKGEPAGKRKDEGFADAQRLKGFAWARCLCSVGTTFRFE